MKSIIQYSYVLFKIYKSLLNEIIIELKYIIHSNSNCYAYWVARLFVTVSVDMIRFIRYRICILTYKAAIIKVFTIGLSLCLLFQIIKCTFCKLSDTIHLYTNNKKGMTFITPNCTINNTKIN